MERPMSRHKAETLKTKPESGRSRFLKKKFPLNHSENGYVRVSKAHGVSLGNRKLVAEVVEGSPNTVTIEVRNIQPQLRARIDYPEKYPDGDPRKEVLRGGANKWKKRVWVNTKSLSTSAATSLGAGIAVFSAAPSMISLVIGAALVAGVVGYTISDEMPDE